MALIGGGGTGEAIAQHPMAGLQGWADELLHVLGPVSGIKEQFSGGPRGRLARWMEQELTEGLPEGSTAGLTGGDHLSPGWQQTTPRQPGSKSIQLAALAAAIDALQHHEATNRAMDVLDRLSAHERVARRWGPS